MEDRLMRKKVKILCYECKKCNKTVYFKSDSHYDTKCKTCKMEMHFFYEHPYKPENGLKAIKGADSKEQQNSLFFSAQKSIVECPYCHSINTSKISSFSKAMAFSFGGIAALAQAGKQWHCNSCKSDF